VLLTVQNARFRRFVRPGDTMVIRTELTALTEGAGRCKAAAKVGETVVATAELMLGYDAGGGSVIPEAARAELQRWAQQVNRTLMGDLPLPAAKPAGSAAC